MIKNNLRHPRHNEDPDFPMEHHQNPVFAISLDPRQLKHHEKEGWQCECGSVGSSVVALPLDRDALPRKSKTCWSIMKFSPRLIIDLFCVTSVVLILLVIETGWLPGAKTGFFCDDRNIAHNFAGDTVSLNLLLGVAFVAPLIAVFAIESSCCHCSGSESGSWFSRAWFHCWVWYREYLLGLGMVILATELAKIMVSEPRPHFLHTCAPDKMANGVEHCKALAADTQGYIEDFTCTNTEVSDYRLRDSIKSFPSGHASVSVFTAIFLICFLQRRMTGVPRKSPSQYLKPWLQCLCITWALGCALSRVNDHRHHPHDVMAGSIVGVIFGLVSARYFCGGFWPGQCAVRLNEDPPSEGNSSGSTAVTSLGPEDRNGAKAHHHQSVRRLLSSTSSYTGSIGTDELREVR